MNCYLNRTALAIISLFVFFSLEACKDPLPENWQWETLQPEGEPTARHEAGLVAFKSKLYLMGGRRINPTSVFDPATNTWTEKAPTPVELHHFQPVVWGMLYTFWVP